MKPLVRDVTDPAALAELVRDLRPEVERLRVVASTADERAATAKLLHRYRNAAERVASFVVVAERRPQLVVEQWARLGKDLAEAAKELEDAVDLLGEVIG
jgi:hypothetical protein